MSQSNATLAEVQTVAVLWSDLRQGDKITSPSGVFTVVSTHKSWDGGGSIVVEERWDRQPLNCRHDSMVNVIVPPISGGSPVAEPFTLTTTKPAPLAAPFRIRPILKFLALPTWDRKTVARFDAFTTRFDAFELLAEAMDAEAAEMMAESLEEQIRQFKRIDKLALPTFHAPHVVAPVAKVATPAVVAKVKPARKAPRKTADIIAEAIDVARTAKNGYESEAIDGVLATLTPAQKVAVTRKLDEHRNGAPIVLFLLACALGVPVSFPEPTPAVEVESPAPVSGPVPTVWFNLTPGDVIAWDQAEYPALTVTKVHTSGPRRGCVEVAEKSNAISFIGDIRCDVIAHETSAPKGWDAIEADDAPAPVSGGSPLATPAVEMQVEPTAYPFGQFDPSGSLWRAELRVIESALRSEVADIIETHREGFEGRETDAGPLVIAQLRYEAMSSQERQDFAEWCDSIGYIPGEADYGRLATDEAFEVFILECLDGCPIFPIYFPPTPPEGGDDEAESRDLPEDVCDGHGALSHTGPGSLAPVARMGDRRDGIGSDRHVADVLEERGQVLDAPEGREADQVVSATGQGASGVPHGGRLTPCYVQERFKGGFQLVPALSLAPLVVTFHGVGHPFHQADATPSPGFPVAPVPRVSSPVLRLSDPLPGVSSPETIEIHGTLYGLERAEGGFTLEKRDGTLHEVAIGLHGHASCTCPDFRFRHAGLPTQGCRHVRGLRSVGLIPAQHAADTPTVEMQPTTPEEVHLMATMESMGIPPVCGGSDEAKPEHTPGPWTIENIFEKEDLSIILDYEVPMAGFPVPVAHLFVDDDGFPIDHKQARANARLVAAAPDLLAALQGVLRVADRKTDEFDAARAAIAKATS